MIILAALSFSAQAQHYVQIDGVVDSTLVLRKLGGDTTYLVSEALTVADSGFLEVEAGTTIYFSQSAYLRVKEG